LRQGSDARPQLVMREMNGTRLPRGSADTYSRRRACLA